MNENRIFLSALILSLVLHLVLAVILWKIPLNLDTSVALAQEPSWDEMVVDIIPDPDQPDPNGARPARFTLVPERLAQEEAPEDPEEAPEDPEEAPEDPDYASLFNSRASDREIGGDGTVPKAGREGELDQVTIIKDDLTASRGVQLVTESFPVNQAADPSEQPGGEDGREEQDAGDPATEQGTWALPPEQPEILPEESPQDQEGQEEAGEIAEEDPLAEWWGGDNPTIMLEGTGNPGDRGFDFSQLESGRTGVGVSFVGDYSLNTYEWNYAPWMKTFISQLHRHWRAPYAYSFLGMIHGETLLKVVVARDGRLLSLEILETEGHGSLHEASEAAMRAFAPYLNLPQGFPEEELVMTWRLVYPALRP